MPHFLFFVFNVWIDAMICNFTSLLSAVGGIVSVTSENVTAESDAVKI